MLLNFLVNREKQVKNTGGYNFIHNILLQWKSLLPRWGKPPTTAMLFGRQFCVTTFENNFPKCGKDDYVHTSPVNSLPLDNELNMYLLNFG